MVQTSRIQTVDDEVAQLRGLSVALNSDLRVLGGVDYIHSSMYVGAQANVESDTS